MPSLLNSPINPAYPDNKDPDVQALADFLNGQGMGPEDYQAPGVGDILAAAPPQTRAQAATPFEQMMATRANTADQADRARANAAIELNNYFTDAASQKRADELKTKIATEQAGPQAAGAAQLAVEQERNRGALELQKQAQQNQAAEMAAEKAKGAEFEPHFDAKGGVSYTETRTPQLVQTQVNNATKGLSSVAATRQIADEVNRRGLLGPTMGPLMNQATSGELPGSLLSYGMHADDLRAFNNLKGSLQEIQTAIASTLGSGRAASSPAILTRFKTLLNPGQNLSTLAGGIDAAERWLTTYANAKNSAELDAADAALGVTGGPYQAGSPGSAQADPYTNPDYQPK